MHKRLKAALLKPKANCLALAAAAVCLMPAAHAADDWFLMSRAGQCMEMGALFAKMPDLANVKTPQEYIALMEAKGNEVSANVTESAKGKTYRVQIASKGLTLTFVEPGVCPL